MVNQRAAALAGLLLAAGLVGTLVPSLGPIMLALVAAVLVVILVLWRPIVGMLLITATIPLQSLVIPGTTISLVRIISVGVLGLWVIRRLASRARWGPLAAVGFVQAAVALVIYSFASVLWSEYSADTMFGATQLVLLMAGGILVVDLVKSWRDVSWVYRAIVVAGLVAGTVVLEQYFIEGVRRAGSGIAGGVNGTAATLVTIVPFAICLAAGRQKLGWRLLGLLYLAVAVAAVAVSFSRTSYVVLPLTCLLMLPGMVRQKGSIGPVVTFLGAVAVAIMLIPTNLVSERVSTIRPVVQQMVRPTGGTLDSRVYHWVVGFHMFRDAPVAGVGYNNYGRLFRERYQFRVPGSAGRGDGIQYQQLRNPHSGHVYFLATGGLMGVGIWLVLLLSGFTHLRAAWSRVAHNRVSDHRLMVWTSGAALLTQILYGMSREVHQDRIFWLVIGLTAALALVSRREAAGPHTISRRADQLRRAALVP